MKGILCSAIWFKDGKKYEHQPKNINTGFVVCGRRHNNCYLTADLLNNEILKKLHEANGKALQGFLTVDDKFVDRKEAGTIAYLSNQINQKTDCLFSEDLY